MKLKSKICVLFDRAGTKYEKPTMWSVQARVNSQSVVY